MTRFVQYTKQIGNVYWSLHATSSIEMTSWVQFILWFDIIFWIYPDHMSCDFFFLVKMHFKFSIRCMISFAARWMHSKVKHVLLASCNSAQHRSKRASCFLSRMAHTVYFCVESTSASVTRFVLFFMLWLITVKWILSSPLPGFIGEMSLFLRNKLVQ